MKAVGGRVGRIPPVANAPAYTRGQTRGLPHGEVADREIAGTVTVVTGESVLRREKHLTTPLRGLLELMGIDVSRP